MRYIILLCCFLLASCGFSPLYMEKSDAQSCQLASIYIHSIQNYGGFLLEKQLQSALNPSQMVQDKKYDLIVTIDKPLISEQNIQDDNFSSRERITLKAHYKLIDKQTKEILITSSAFAVGAYNIALEPYATYMAKEKIKENLIQILSDRISIHIISFMRQKGVECEG